MERERSMQLEAFLQHCFSDKDSSPGLLPHCAHHLNRDRSRCSRSIPRTRADPCMVVVRVAFAAIPTR